MKRMLLLISLAWLGCSALSAQEEYRTVFHNKEGRVKVRGFGGPMMSFGTIDGYFAHMMGGGGAVMINNFFIGGYGMGLTTPVPHKEWVKDEITGEQSRQTSNSENLSFGHGGFWTGLVLAPNYPVHLSLSSQFGWGALGSNYGGLDIEPVDPYLERVVFVITPIVEAEFNFSRFFKVGLGGSMSFVQGLNTADSAYTMEDFMNPNVYLSFKFGWFN